MSHDDPLRERIGAALATVHARIDAAARAAGRDPGDVRLVAVSKRQDAALVAAAVACGHRDFGENYVQEGLAKIETVRALVGPDPELRWHMIGHLQSNKAARVASAFALVHGLDSLKAAAALGRGAVAAGTTAHALVQVHLGGHAGRGGVGIDEVEAFVAGAADIDGLQLDGVMGVAPPDEDPRPYFARLRQIAERLQALALPRAPMREISAGMTGDFEAAIAEGATLVRVGTAIFGKRPAVSAADAHDLGGEGGTLG